MLPSGDDKYPGPFAKECHLETLCLLNSDNGLPPNKQSNIKNGLVLELVHLVSRKKLAKRKVFDWLQLFIPTHSQAYSQKTLESKIARTVESEKKFKKKKKHPVYKSIDEFLNANFFDNINKIVEKKNTKSVNTESKEKEIEAQCKDTIKLTLPPRACINEVCMSNINDKITKDVNLVRYELSKEQKRLTVLQKLVENERDNLENLKAVKGHFSVRNVTKRDETARNTRKSLRASLSVQAKQQQEIVKLQREIVLIRNRLCENESENVTSSIELQRLKTANHKKTKAQRLTSHYRNAVKKLKNNDHSECVKLELQKKQDEIEFLLAENELLKEKLNDSKCVTKNKDGSFSNNLRLCVLELFALELGMEKIPAAIESVSNHMFNCNLQKTDLPTAQTVRNIVDEGHYLAKRFIAMKIDSAENIGISRDGTSRKKKKIVDTSVTLDSGEVMSLGFKHVARETAEVINCVTKKHLTELAETITNDNNNHDQEDKINSFIAMSLQKLSFTMSDRASNEKLADKLLNEWRDKVLTNCVNENEKQAVFHFHCMAHVLLGFHRYVTEDLKKYERKLTEEEGPIGRDILPNFKYWSKKRTVAERIVYTTSGIFGPAGDHLGIRDRWEAYCATNGIKSLIGNYQDNRFNSLFQTAAEVFLHSDSFLHVIKTVPTPNQKIVSVAADLQSETVQTILRALTIMYVKITGPYWWLVTSGSVSYLHLYPYVQNLEQYLTDCAENPTFLTVAESTWIKEEELFTPYLTKFNDKLSQPIQNCQLKLCKDILCIMCNSMLKTVRKQLADFLDGQYSCTPSKEDEKRTSFAQVTNLACEHHFGDLDSSQRKRPNATFHHHSSVQMLKRNRRKMMSWLTEMPQTEQSDVMKKARKGGVDLRKRHREEEVAVQEEILQVMEKGQKARRRKLDDRDCEPDNEYDELSVQKILPEMKEGLKEGEYVVVAYQDSWYPGCVSSVNSNKDKASVSFMAPCRKAGTFFWPARKDIQIVDKEFVIRRDIVPECLHSGRQWFFKEYEHVTEIYLKYKAVFFN